MNKFLNKVDVKIEGSEPSFLNGQIDTGAIQRTGTSGDRMTDIAFDKAIKLANELNDLNKANELSNLKLEGQNKVLNYETEWNDKDKFSEENFSKYKEGLENILKENAEAINKTKYTSEADVISWKDSHQTDMTNQLYKLKGQKAQYDIKATTDMTMLNIKSMTDSYVSTGDESMKKQIVGLYDNLKKFMPEHEVEIMKIQNLTDMNTKRASFYLDGIVNNPNLSTEEKLNQLKLAGQAVSDTLLRKVDAEQAVRDGYISKDYMDAYINYSKSVQENSLLKQNGTISRLNEAISNERYVNDTKIRNEQERLQKQYENDITDVSKGFKNGDDLKAISILEGRNIQQEELVGNETLSKKYYGETPQEILKQGKYIPSKSKYEINEMKSQSRIDIENGVNRSTTLNAIYTNLKESDDKTGNVMRNNERQLISEGVITSVESSLLNNPNNEIGGYKKDEWVDMNNAGNKLSNLNKLNGFVGIDKSLLPIELNNKIDSMDYVKRKQLTSLIVGGVASGKFGELININKGVDTTQFRMAYNSNKDFKNYVDNAVLIVENAPSDKYEPISRKNVDIVGQINERYTNKTITLREKTKESGTDYKTREVKIEPFTYDSLESGLFN